MTAAAQQAGDITDAYLAAFLDHVLRQRSEPLLTAGSPRFPEVRREG